MNLDQFFIESTIARAVDLDVPLTAVHMVRTEPLQRQYTELTLGIASTLARRRVHLAATVSAAAQRRRNREWLAGA